MRRGSCRAAAASISPRSSRSSGGIQCEPERLVDVFLGRAGHACRRPSTRNRPYSFSLKPRPIARSRSAMLWAFEPVKYCRAAPRLSAATSRRSAWKPPARRTLDFVSPCASTRSTSAVADERVHQRRSARRRRGCRDRRRSRSRAAGCRPASIVRGRRVLAQVADERRGGVVGVRQQMPAGVPLALLERLEDQRFLLRAHARAARGCGRRPPPARDRRACGCRARGTASRPSSVRRPAGAAGRGSSAETRRPARGGRSASPVSAISRIRAARSLPMPGISRRPAASSAASSCGWLATMSAPLRYARILNGLSFLISRRSAISRRMRAIARLSKPQAFRLDAVVEHARAAGAPAPRRSRRARSGGP